VEKARGKIQENRGTQRENPAENRKHVNFTKSYPTAWGTTPKLFQLLQCPASAKAVASTNQRGEASTSDDSNDESSTLDSTSPKKRRK